jgi:sterol desaturase/sphingolipid hydroxylase (fatty acid hydroxylase superfamily)
MHRVHHSSHQPETDSNYGATLSIWDRLFGTYTEKEPEELAIMQLGLKECQDNRSTSFWWQLRLPFTPSRIEKIEMKHISPKETKIS